MITEVITEGVLPVASFAEAWIEIGLVEALPQIVGCRLLRGGVD